MAKTQGILPDGTRVRLKSGTEGWVEGEVVQYYDVIPVVGGMMYGGGVTPGYEVRVLQGKHKGQTLRLPLNYVEPAPSPSGEPAQKTTQAWSPQDFAWYRANRKKR